MKFLPHFSSFSWAQSARHIYRNFIDDWNQEVGDRSASLDVKKRYYQRMEQLFKAANEDVRGVEVPETEIGAEMLYGALKEHLDEKKTFKILNLLLLKGFDVDTFFPGDRVSIANDTFTVRRARGDEVETVRLFDYGDFEEEEDQEEEITFHERVKQQLGRLADRIKVGPTTIPLRNGKLAALQPQTPEKVVVDEPEVVTVTEPVDLPPLETATEGLFFRVVGLEMDFFTAEQATEVAAFMDQLLQEPNLLSQVSPEQRAPFLRISQFSYHVAFAPQPGQGPTDVGVVRLTAPILDDAMISPQRAQTFVEFLNERWAQRYPSQESLQTAITQAQSLVQVQTVEGELEKQDENKNTALTFDEPLDFRLTEGPLTPESIQPYEQQGDSFIIPEFPVEFRTERQVQRVHEFLRTIVRDTNLIGQVDPAQDRPFQNTFSTRIFLCPTPEATPDGEGSIELLNLPVELNSHRLVLANYLNRFSVWYR